MYGAVKDDHFGLRQAELTQRFEFAVWTTVMIDFFETFNKFGFLTDWTHGGSNNYFLDYYLQ